MTKPPALRAARCEVKLFWGERGNDGRRKEDEKSESRRFSRTFAGCKGFEAQKQRAGAHFPTLIEKHAPALINRTGGQAAFFYFTRTLAVSTSAELPPAMIWNTPGSTTCRILLL